MSEISYNDLDWLQNGEPVTGGTTSAPSAGVMNRPLLELLQNDKDLNTSVGANETELQDARGTYDSLDERLDASDQRIETLEVSRALDNRSIEVNAEAMRARMPSAFDYNGYNEKGVFDGTFDSSVRDNAPYRLVVPTGDLNSINKIGLEGTPCPLYVNGIKIVLDQYPTNKFSAVIDLGQAPENGGRLDYVFLEVWKEKIKLGEESDVLFPFGAVFFNSDESTFDGCQLESSNLSGTYSPEYLANATNHGKYVVSTDDNILNFIEDVRNNVVMDTDGDYYQYRWRFRVAQDVTYPDNVYPWQFADTVHAQGMKASPTNTSFTAVADDVGLSVASLNTLSLDGKCYAVPIAIIHRRNSDNFSLANMNGASAYADGASSRPDGKFYDIIDIHDMLDLRQHSVPDGNFNLPAIARRNQAKLFSSSLDTVFEQYMADPDGNGEYVGTDIYGTELLRADCLTGSSVIESTWQVQTQLKAQNGITSKLDGYRAYYGNIESEAAIIGEIEDLTVSAIKPNVFTYNATNHQITFNASGLDSGNTNNSGLAGRTVVSTTEPVVNFGFLEFGSFRLTEMSPSGSWSGLGTDVATFTMEDKSYFVCRCNSASGYTVVLGDTYTSTNGITCTVIGFTSDFLYTAFEYAGGTMPIGTLTQATGTGTLTSMIIADSGKGSNSNEPNPISMINVGITPKTGLTVGDVYTDSNSNQLTVQKIYGDGVEFGKTSAYTAVTGTYTKVSGNGPATLNISNIYPDVKYTINGANSVLSKNNKCSYLVSTVSGQIQSVYITLYVKFTNNSGILSRVPNLDTKWYLNNEGQMETSPSHTNTSIVGTQHIVGANQVLPNNGYDFLPVGYGDTEGFDSHTRTIGLQHFLYNEPVVTASDFGEDKKILATEVIHPSDSDKFMMYTTIEGDGVYYLESENGISWSIPTKVVNTSDTYLAVKVLYEGSASASAYKMILTKYVSTTENVQQYCYSADGQAWSTPQTVIEATNLFDISITDSVARVIAFNKLASSYGILLGSFKASENYVQRWTTPDMTTFSHQFVEDRLDNGKYKFSEEIAEASVIKLISPIALGFTSAVSEASFHVHDKFSLTTIKTGKYIINAGASESCTVVKGMGAYNMWFVDEDSDTHETRIWYTVLADRDSQQTGYEDRNYSATEGDSNTAPSLGSIIVLFYKAKAEQTDRGLASYVDSNATCKSLGVMNDEGLVCTDDDSSVASSDNGYYIPYRDVLCGAIYPSETVANKQAYSNANEITDPNTVVFLDSAFSMTDAMYHTLIKSNIWGNDSEIGVPEDLPIEYVDTSCGVPMNISDIPYNSLISQARAMQEDASEYVSELFDINKRMYLIAAKNTGSYKFNARVKPCRPLGNPIFK